MSGVMFDRRIAPRLKGTGYKTVVKLAMIYGSKTLALSKRQEAELEMAGTRDQEQLRSLEIKIEWKS